MGGGGGGGGGGVVEEIAEMPEFRFQRLRAYSYRVEHGRFPSFGPLSLL